MYASLSSGKVAFKVESWKNLAGGQKKAFAYCQNLLVDCRKNTILNLLSYSVKFRSIAVQELSSERKQKRECIRDRYSRQVWFTNGQSVSSCQIVRIFGRRVKWHQPSECTQYILSVSVQIRMGFVHLFLLQGPMPFYPSPLLSLRGLSPL